MTAVAEQPAQEVPWWVVLIQGIAALILGVFLLTQPLMTTLVLVQFIGLYWLIAGIFSIIGIFIRKGEPWGWALFSGIVGILAGLVILGMGAFAAALLVSTTFVIVLGLWGIIIGIVNLIQAFKGGGWGVGILGALSIIFGILLIMRPVAAALALPWVFGIFGIVGGIIAIIAAFRLRRA
jgi:uncharacterized membrane protein HdeD (DUF308 family)